MDESAGRTNERYTHSRDVRYFRAAEALFSASLRSLSLSLARARIKVKFELLEKLLRYSQFPSRFLISVT